MAADKEILKTIEHLRLDRPGRAYRAAEDGGTTGAPALGLALTELATTYREEAELWAKSGAKGWKGAEAEAYLIAQAMDDVAAKLDNAGGGAALSVSDPVALPRQFADTTHERLDDFVNSAVAAGDGALKTEIGPTSTGETHDVTAYLRGDVDTLPGLREALVPNSVTVLREHAATTGAPNDDVTGDEQRIMIRGIADTSGVTDEQRAKLDGLHDVTITMPKTWESDTMTPDGHRIPGTGLAPTLGQPGDMGAGYSHAYVPAGGRAFTYAELLTPIPAATLPPHLSHSQIGDVGDCAAKYRMQRVEQLPQIPQWANIGGTTLHAAVEALERTIVDRGVHIGPDDTFPGYDVELSWKHHFEATIAATQAVSSVPQSVWRSSRKGAEGEQWWWVNGPLMLRRYLDARPAEPTSNLPADPNAINGAVDPFQLAIELEITADVPTPYGLIPFVAKLDRVTNAPQPGPDSPESNWITLVIRDYKTSYERPTDTTQLGDYAHALRLWGVPESVRILGTYFDARRGVWTEPVDLLQAHSFESFQYRVTTAHAQKRALTTGPTPARPSNYCGGCAVRYACPIMSTKN